MVSVAPRRAHKPLLVDLCLSPRGLDSAAPHKNMGLMWRTSVFHPPLLSIQSGSAWGLCRNRVFPVLPGSQLYHWWEHRCSWLVPPPLRGLSSGSSPHVPKTICNNVFKNRAVFQMCTLWFKVFREIKPHQKRVCNAKLDLKEQNNLSLPENKMWGSGILGKKKKV